MFEAAVACCSITQNLKLSDVAIHFADLIESVFGTEGYRFESCRAWL